MRRCFPSKTVALGRHSLYVDFSYRWQHGHKQNEVSLVEARSEELTEPSIVGDAFLGNDWIIHVLSPSFNFSVPSFNFIVDFASNIYSTLELCSALSDKVTLSLVREDFINDAGGLCGESEYMVVIGIGFRTASAVEILAPLVPEIV
jgi:hypothetical protein